MAIEEKNTTFKVKWQAVSSNIKSQEIDLEEGIKVCFGVKNNLFHHVVYLVSKTCQPSTLEISEVFFATCNAPEQRKQMKLVIAEGPTYVFSTDVVDWKSPLTLTCWISLKIKDTMGEFSHQLIDSNLSDNLWTAAKRARYTDVEFRIGQPSKQKVFTAHRSILAARSSIFAGQFDKDCQLNSIVIEDVHHSVFKQFLRFLYTGQLKVASVSNMSELLTLADRYQIAALQNLCRNPIQEMNASELTSLIISLNNPSTPSRADSFTSKSTGVRSTQISPTAAADGLSLSHSSFQESMQQGQVSIHELLNWIEICNNYWLCRGAHLVVKADPTSLVWVVLFLQVPTTTIPSLKQTYPTVDPCRFALRLPVLMQVRRTTRIALLPRQLGKHDPSKLRWTHQHLRKAKFNSSRSLETSARAHWSVAKPMTLSTPKSCLWSNHSVLKQCSTYSSV